MAPRRKYPSPVEQLLELARWARAGGQDFDTFWLRAVRPGVQPVVQASWPAEEIPPAVVVWPSDGGDRRFWIRAIVGAEETWRAAYERRPLSKIDQTMAVITDSVYGDSVESEAAARSVGHVHSGPVVRVR